MSLEPIIIQIQPGDVVAINVFTVKPGMQQQFIETQIAEYRRLDGKITGSLSVGLHRSLDGTKAVNYARFESLEAIKAWTSSELFKDHMQRIEQFLEKVEPGVYEPVFVKEVGRLDD